MVCQRDNVIRMIETSDELSKVKDSKAEQEIVGAVAASAPASADAGEQIGTKPAPWDFPETGDSGTLNPREVAP
jgi:hypothetical protein